MGSLTTCLCRSPVRARFSSATALEGADPTHGGSGAESIAGFEYAGEVAAVGENAGDWNVGDMVMGSIPQAFAEYAVAGHRFVLPRPEGLSPEVACALPTGLLTEHGARLDAGHRHGPGPGGPIPERIRDRTIPED